MAVFMIRFLICNVFISGIIGILMIAKWIFRNSLSSRMHYNLWFILLGLLAVPFIPLRLMGVPQIISYLYSLRNSSTLDTKTAMKGAVDVISYENANWMNDFTLSVNRETPPFFGYILLGIWIIGIFAMIRFMTKSTLRLRTLKRSALPLQNLRVRKLYNHCLDEMGIDRDIPVYSTAFLKSPIIVGLLKPCIYLPIHLIADFTPSYSTNYKGSNINGCIDVYTESDIRYMLLHELQHYKHKDALSNYLMNLAVTIYWFNPLVWYAMKEMQSDREIACDTSVLKMLKEDDYVEYGNTLINFAQKVSLTPFATGLGGNMKQMKRRIINIATYKKPTSRKKLKGIIAFGLTTIILLSLAPFISTYATDKSHYQWESSSNNISYVDLSMYFKEYDGSFVLYDLENDAWSIYDIENATLRVSPDSTYKIYNALFGLEQGVITPENSLMVWNGEIYPFEAWNVDQTLQTAMTSSVNWYFQAVDELIGASNVYSYIHEIGYGNESISGDFSTYWMESSLKISPVEQVELLIKLHRNSLDFAPENIDAVKDSIYLSSSDMGTLYGKTGTGRVDGQDVNGWFIGYIETAQNTYFFATNIRADGGATGSRATEITMSIFSDKNIWQSHTTDM